MRTITELQQLSSDKRYRDALLLVDELLSREPDCQYLLVRRAILIMLQEDCSGPTLEDAERDLLRAHEISPRNLDALEELAHLYDAVIPIKPKAKLFAKLYVEEVKETLAEMAEILDEE